MTSKKWFLIALFFCFFYLIILQVIAIWPFTIDDMYISLRYAKNWAGGYDLLWNPGEEPVEGYSNFSFVVIAALAIRSGFDPIFLLKALGVLSLLLSTIALYYLSRLWLSRKLAFIPCLWMLSYKGELIWAASGLETIFFQALICLSLLLLLRGLGYCFCPEQRQQPQSHFLAVAGILLALASITRPETPILVMLFYALALIDRPKVAKNDFFKKILLSAAIYLAIYLPYFFWRWHYYQQLLPNPVYCKGYSGFWALLDVNYLYLFLPFFCLSLPAIFKAKDKLAYFFWLPSIIYLILLLNADPVAAFENRLFLPVFVLILPLSLLGLCRGLNYLFTKNDGYYYTALLICILGMALLFLQPLSLTGYRNFTQFPQSGIRLRDKILGWLENNVPSTSQVVLGDSGQIPYFSSLRFIDSYCLNNKAMAKMQNTNRYQGFCEEILIKKPQVLILTSARYRKGNLIYAPTDACLHEKLKGNKNYQLQYLSQVAHQENYYRYEIYTLIN